MSAYLGAVSITTKRGDLLRLQVGPIGQARRNKTPELGSRYRCALENGFHCGHWHRTPEDAVACMVAKGAQAS